MRNLLLFSLITFVSISSCSTNNFNKTVERVNLNRFMGKWYVITGRFTFLEKGAYNATESYKWNDKHQRVDIDYRFNEDSLTGPVKKIPQKANIYNKKTNAHWKVSPMWPLKFDYLVIALADDYTWCAIGVPSQKYLWIMARKAKLSERQLKKIINKIKDTGYDTNNLTYIEHDKDEN